jgi:hypothetical protein
MSMAVLADPLVRLRLDDFCQTVEALCKDGSLSDPLRIDAIRQLCELSRNTKFDLGPLEFANPAQATELADCFEDAVHRIRGLWPAGSVPGLVDRYCENIMSRARRCRRER